MISDSKLLASAAWDAQSLNELKAKAGEDPAANIRPVARQVEGMFVPADCPTDDGGQRSGAGRDDG